MKTLTAALTVAALLPASAAFAHQGHGYKVRHATQQVQPLKVRVSCQRFFSDEVIWDRPNGVFIDDLRAAGYNPSDSQSIATSVCRDERLVDNPEGLGDKMREILASNPPRR